MWLRIARKSRLTSLRPCSNAISLVLKLLESILVLSSLPRWPTMMRTLVRVPDCLVYVHRAPFELGCVGQELGLADLDCSATPG